MSTREAMKGELQITASPKIIFGAGTVAERLRSEIDALGARRVLIVTGNSLAANADLISTLYSALGPTYAGIFQGTRPHVPRETVLAGAEMARDLGADALIAFGGGSPIDTAKGIAVVVAEGGDFDALKMRHDADGTLIVPPMPKPKMPVIAIPTALAGAEFTYAAGVTDPATHEKEGLIDMKILPRAVFLDPKMTVATPQDLWTGTGVKSLSDGIEMLCCLARQPYTDGLVTEAVQIFFRELPRSIGEPLDLAARGALQYASFLVVGLYLMIGGGLAGGLRHQGAPMWNAAHGVFAGIVLPHVMEFNRAAIADRLELIARVAGIDTRGLTTDEAAKAAIIAARNLVAALGLPTRLSEIGAVRDYFPAVAEHVLTDYAVAGQKLPRPVTSQQQIVELLEAAY